MNATTKRIPTMKEMNEMKRIMLERGWNYVGSVMSGDKGDTRYGLLFTKALERREFWLNIDTMDNLPTD